MNNEVYNGRVNFRRMELLDTLKNFENLLIIYTYLSVHLSDRLCVCFVEQLIPRDRFA